MSEQEAADRIRMLESLVMSLACKLAIVSEHLGVLAERKEVRRLARSVYRKQATVVCNVCDGDGLLTGPPECRPCKRCRGQGRIVLA